MTAEEMIMLLDLKPHPEEGGYYSEIYRSEEEIAAGALPDRYCGSRQFGTAIYYLLTPGTCSRMHRLKSDEIFHFYQGDPVQMLHLWPDGFGREIILGADLARGQRPQVVVGHGVWQGARLTPGGQLALMGTTVAPGFEFADYETASREQLFHEYPKFHDLIVALTRS